jgi:hypothetical protein
MAQPVDQNSLKEVLLTVEEVEAMAGSGDSLTPFISGDA